MRARYSDASIDHLSITIGDFKVFGVGSHHNLLVTRNTRAPSGDTLHVGILVDGCIGVFGEKTDDHHCYCKNDGKKSI